MATYSKLLLSGSTQGKQIKVTGTATGSSVTVHTAVSGTSDLDEIWIYAYNHHTAAVQLTIEWGGTSDPDNLMSFSIPYKSGRTLCIDGALLQNGLVVKAFAGTANVIMIDGFVNRITA